MSESQEGKSAQEQQEEELIEEFSGIDKLAALQSYEGKNRKKIGEASLIVRDAFDKKWKAVTGNSYFQPVTTIQTEGPTVNRERHDPAGRKYMANVLFKEILWQKLPRRKIGKRFVDLFSLQGVTENSGILRPIFQNLAKDRLKEILGEKETDKILQKVMKKEDHGSLKGKFNLKVEGFWEVLFNPKKDANDPKDVRLLWEGQCLIMQRMEPVIIPGFYLEVADHATRDQYIQNPDEGRKKIGVIQEYPYTTLREATYEEFLEMKGKGDKIMRDIIAKEG